MVKNKSPVRLWYVRVASVVEYLEVGLSVVCDVESELFEDTVDGIFIVVFVTSEDPVTPVIEEDTVDGIFVVVFVTSEDPVTPVIEEDSVDGIFVVVFVTSEDLVTPVIAEDPVGESSLFVEAVEKVEVVSVVC